MQQQTAQEMFLEVRELYNNQAYQEAAELFARYDAEIATDSERRAALNCYRIIRTRSLLALDDEDAAHKDIEFLNTHYADNAAVLDGARQMMDHLGMPEFILKLKPQLGTTVAAQAKYAKSIGDIPKFLALCEQHQSIDPHDAEFKIYLKPGAAEKPYMFAGEQIENCSVQDDLPNNNLYINLILRQEDIKTDISIPGPDNDSICDEGHIRIEGGEGNIDLIINRFDVSDYMLLSPFGLEVATPDITLRIFNLNRVRTDGRQG